MKKKIPPTSKSIVSVRTYTVPKNSLSTIVDRQTMEQIYYDLDNPPKGTASLNKILKAIDSEQHP